MDTTPVNPLVIEANAIEALQTVFDPEIPVNIWELGLIYGIRVDPSGAVGVRMTLTSPNCPSAAELPQVDAAQDVLVGLGRPCRC
jgi:metal-sulfur cluster biosynthetic enzyme